MNTRNRSTRILSWLLALVMIFSMIPTAVFAASGQTVWGDPVEIAVAQEDAVARENDFNKGWKFNLGASSTAQNENFDDSSWKTVNLPHDFSITQNFTTSAEAESGFLPGGTGWYRKTFTMPTEAAGKTVLLNFDGVYSDAYVYVNGSYVGEHHYGYTPFALDLTGLLTCDGVKENVIAVKSVNNLPTSRWYSGSGIYRDVTLIVTDPVHVERNGVTVTTPHVENGTGDVEVTTVLCNDAAQSVQATVTSSVLKKNHSTVLATASTTVLLNGGASSTAETSMTLASYDLWDISSPNLYVLRTEVTVDGQVVDTTETEFGFRWFSFDSSGFHLNGRNVKLNGVCMHHDQGALGSAAYDDAMYRQLSIMKDMGVNAIRTAHNPADADYIAICNELGLLVIEEVFDGLIDYKNENTNDFSKYFETSVSTGLYGAASGMTCAQYAAQSTVARDKNAPSIIAWSFGNEIQEGTYWTNVAKYDDICQQFIQWVKAEDSTRPITSGDNNRGDDSNLVNVINVILNNGGIAGFNYANSTSTLASLASSFGGSTGCIIASETSSAVNSRSMYKSQTSLANADGKYHLTSYDTSCVTWGITAHESIYNTYQYDNVAGEFIWTGFDYIGEPTPWNKTSSGSQTGSGAIPNSSYFGAVETTGFEKDSFYLYRSQWNKEETTLHLVTAWDSDNYMTTSGKTPVWIYSNAPVVKLYRDGTLIGTATRKANTSAAGHTYYTYSTKSNSTGICTAVSGSGSAALYAVFNVAYTAGTLSAKAFDENGTEIALTGNCGKHTVTTPGTAASLNVTQNRTEMAADGSSLVYITVDVTDADGNLDTTATNTIYFTLEGNGEIAGVDNGDQATTAKYQQSSVLTGTTSANIKAYAGKALVIVRATEDAGEIRLTASASGLTGGSVSVTTTAQSEATHDGLRSYRMVKDYSVKVGTAPMLDASAVGILADGSEVEGDIVWNAVNDQQYQNAGDYTIQGTVSFAGYAPMEVTARLHVIDNVIALHNLATATTPGTVPTLPGVVSGVLADGTRSGEFAVEWEPVSEDMLAQVGDVITVNGTAVVFAEETLPVCCTIRVAQQVQTESTNIAPQVLSLTQDIASSYQSDVLSSIINGTTKPGDNTSERWTNWNNRRNSQTATLTMTWATAHTIGGVNLYYYYDSCCAYPEAITFLYSLDGQQYEEISAQAELVEEYSLGAKYAYTFDEPVDPVGLKLVLTQKNGTSGTNCVGLTEVEVMTYAGTLEYETSADLSGIAVDGVALEDFAADTLTYTAVGTTVTAQTAVNASVTVLPALDGVVRILTVSEDGLTEKTYSVTLESGCTHQHTEFRNQQTQTCTEDGYTGDLWCLDCDTCVETGEELTATGHQHTELRDQAEPGCETTGYTGDLWCLDCNTCVETGKTVEATGHSWDDGVITREPTETEDGIKLFTCKNCGNNRTERVAYEKELKVPAVSLALTANDEGRIVMTAQVEDWENLDDYYEITSHGILYLYTYRLGNRYLSVNTSGRTKLNFSGYLDGGSYVYRLKPSNQTVSYTVRAYLSYVDPETGKTVYVYSDCARGSYNSLK